MNSYSYNQMKRGKNMEEYFYMDNATFIRIQYLERRN